MSDSAPGDPPPASGSTPDDFDWDWAESDPDWVPPAVDPARVSSARVYDYLLGGKDNYEVDRAAARHLLEIAPYSPDVARANRGFLERAVRHLASERGIGQFIDLGAGIPTSPCVHEIARAAVPGAQVVYVDNDPVVLAQTRAMLATGGGTVALQRDLREPDTILDDPAVRAIIDYGRPVGLLLVAVLHFVTMDQAPALLARYRDALAPGSCLAISAVCRDGSDPEALRRAEAMLDNSDVTAYPRTRAQIAQLFEGLRLTAPITDVTEWLQPDGVPLPLRALAGVGIKD